MPANLQSLVRQQYLHLLLPAAIIVAMLSTDFVAKSDSRHGVAIALVASSMTVAIGFTLARNAPRNPILDVGPLTAPNWTTMMIAVAWAVHPWSSWIEAIVIAIMLACAAWALLLVVLIYRRSRRQLSVDEQAL